MFLEAFVQQANNQFWFSAAQASQFAKQVAQDFNPIHDEGSKRFCVPGDLLFAYLLSKYGLSQKMSCRFDGMVGAETPLHLVETANMVQIRDQQDKIYLSLTQQGEKQAECHFIEHLVKDYVRFSGQNFPHILQPLMQQHQVMIHPQRPMVIYQSMALEFSRFSHNCPQLQLSGSSLSVEGKRGQVLLQFELSDGDEIIGVGEKRMILSNLVPYDEQQMQGLVDIYNQRKTALAPQI